MVEMITAEQGLSLLRQALDNPTANFRDGQWEAIADLIENRSRLLVVQRTGWGKSLVYFLATRILRDRGSGPTLLISPLLALMRNQIAAAKRIDIEAATINSSNVEEWELVKTQLLAGQVDILLISPERLANEEFRDSILLPIAKKIGLFVVDEAHCISDWGHDFRPDYRRIVRILQALPQNIPALATTATANNRVVDDILAQLGSSLRLSRGPLIRESLQLQNIYLPSAAARMAWLAEHLPNISGSGIIYTLTVRDAKRVADWLQTQGIDAQAYHSKLKEEREELEDQLLHNRIKALVATTALGMGFDKPDLGFVIHYQPLGEEYRDVLQTEIQDNKHSIYATVLPLILDRLDRPLDDNSLAKDLDLQVGQMRKWLNRAVAEGKVIKTKNPVRYVVNGSAIQLSLLEE